MDEQRTIPDSETAVIAKMSGIALTEEQLLSVSNYVRTANDMYKIIANVPTDDLTLAGRFFPDACLIIVQDAKRSHQRSD